MKTGIIPVVAMVFLLLISCGEDQKDPQEFTISKETVSETKEVETTTVSEIPEEGPPEDSSEEVTEILLTANDRMQFSLDKIEVQSGQKIRLVLQHVGELNENVMGHNFVLLKKGTAIPEFATKAAGAKGNEYIPKDSESIIAHTELIGGGQKTSITFTAPEPGTYDYICSFPGHFVQMQGKFIVE